MRRRLRALPAVWLVLLLAAPVAAWLLGARQPLLQNTPKTPFPLFNRSSLRDPKTFAKLDAAILDRLPLRGLALNVHATVALDVFHESTNPEVAVGSNGWLYLVPELVPCVPGGRPISDPADAVDAMARTLVAAGYRTAVVIADAKQFVHGQDRPTVDAAQERCLRDTEYRIDDRLAHTPGGLAVNAALRRMEARGVATFLRTDSHWNWRGREVFARMVLDRIRPGLAEETGVHAGPPFAWPGNLDMLMGLDRTEPDRVIVARRRPAHPLPPGSVVLIGDSQLGVSLLTPVSAEPSIHDEALPGQPSCTWPDFTDGNCDDRIRHAHTIVFEKVSRDLLSVSLFCWRPIAIAGEHLRGAPGQWERLDGDAHSATGVTIPASGVATVSVRPPSGDVSAVPRLLRLPIVHYVAPPGGTPTPVTLTQQPRNGGLAPCAMPSQAAPRGALFLPVPAGRRASDLVIQLHSAPGTRLGAPEEILLDGRRLVRASTPRRRRSV